ncbi:radical SAM protein [Hippea jasoniae]|uniref:radical SAM protein n=1 Tax=Hippea jasoniae TaxID=944479 RepID=UPI0005595A8C|nr:radical SAM protein [Hippea jasoniae]
MSYIPRYIKTFEEGRLDEKIHKAFENLKKCTICPRLCRVDRTRGKKGICNTAVKVGIADFFPHFGEERVLVGKRGSGTIFISCCNLLCIYCQNASTSHLCEGQLYSPSAFASMMIKLQNAGCHNINIVTPTHIVPQLLLALKIAIKKGLNIPLVYNTSGYELPKTLKILEGVVDIYLADFKYSNPLYAELYSSAKDYPTITKKALKIMYKQVGNLKVQNATKGLMIRHLVLPNNIAGTKEVVDFIATELSPFVYVNIMPQYLPLGEAYRFEELARPITEEEYLQALIYAKEAGLKNLDPYCVEFLKRRGITI